MNLTPALQVVGLVIGIGALLVLGSPVLVPIALAAVLAMVLMPMFRWLRRHGLGERLAIAVSVSALVLFAAAVAGLLTLQVAQVSKDWPEISRSLTDLYERGQAAAATRLGVPAEAIEQRATRALANAGGLAARFFGTAMGLAALAFLTFVLIILMLLERERFAGFALRMTRPANRERTQATLDEMVAVASQYLAGKLKVMAVMSTVYLVAFLLGGVKYAVLLALLIAMSSIIPYVGNLFGGTLAALLAFVSSGGTAAVIVLAVLLLAQVLENYVLEPFIVGQQVDLNPFMTVFAVFALGAAWGVVGAVLALPLAGMLKVALARQKSTEPLAYLMQSRG